MHVVAQDCGVELLWRTEDVAASVAGEQSLRIEALRLERGKVYASGECWGESFVLRQFKGGHGKAPLWLVTKSVINVTDGGV